MAPLDTTIRHLPPDDEPAAQPWTGMVEDETPAAGSLVVETSEDGGVTVRVVEDDKPRRDKGFDENLASHPSIEPYLAEIAQDVLDGVAADISSRQRFVDNYTKGLDLLGLNIENQERTKGQKRKTSTSRDMTLLESVVKAQSQARGELLPASGPAKVQTVAGAGEQEDTRAADFESDFNLALTKGMKEYVPDLDRGLFGLFYGGNMFRYGYIDPLKGRPVVDTVGVEDLIVSEEARSLDTATRWTIRVPEMSPREAKRRMFYGLWRDVALGTPLPQTDATQQKLQAIAGVTAMAQRPQDQPYTIYQTVVDLDLTVYGIKEKGAPKGMPLPYRVTTEASSRQVLRIERFWKQGDKRFNRKQRCIHYAMVPGFGFLAYGFLHLQGNQTTTLTAIIRLLVDAMMFGTFPGGMKIKNVRTDTNEIEPGPGEFVDVGVPGGVDDLRKAVMALPYKDLSPVSIQLYEIIQQATARVGAAAMMEVGEGRANVPVGTIMAMLEEKAVLMSAVHKRLHESMSQELSMIRELFAERPETLAEVLDNPRRQWAAAEEFTDLDLVPASDPNVPSQVHRVMLATALGTLASMPVFQGRLDIGDILKRIFRMIGVSDADSVVVDAPAQGADPAETKAKADLQAKQLDVQAKERENQRKAAHEAVESQQQDRDSMREAQNDALNRSSDEKIALIREETARMKLVAEQERAAREHQHAIAQTAMTDRHHADDVQARSFGGKGL